MNNLLKHNTVSNQNNTVPILFANKFFKVNELLYIYIFLKFWCRLILENYIKVYSTVTNFWELCFIIIINFEWVNKKSYFCAKGIHNN